MNLRSTKNKRLWRVTLFALCFLIFIFVLRAKTGVYNGGSTAKVTASTASKLWLKAQKLEVRSVYSAGPLLFWMVSLFLFGLYLHRVPRLQHTTVTQAPRPLPLWQLHRFLRPPPAA